MPTPEELRSEVDTLRREIANLKDVINTLAAYVMALDEEEYEELPVPQDNRDPGNNDYNNLDPFAS